MSIESSSREEGDATLSGALRAIEVALRRASKAVSRPRALYALLWSASAAGAVLLSALLAAALLPPSWSNWVIPALLLIGAVGVASACIAALYVNVFRSVDELEIAAEIQRHAPRFRHDLVSALRFGRALEREDFNEARASPSMARLHVQRVASRLAPSGEDRDLSVYLPKPDVRPALWTFFGVFAALLVPTLWAPGWVAQSLSGGLEQVVEQAASQLSDPVEVRPVIGNLSLRLRPPEYTGRAERLEMFTTGHAQVIAGTHVALEGFVLPGRATQVELVLERAAAEEGASEPTRSVHALERHGDGRARGEFFAHSSLTYWFRATLQDGTQLEESARRVISVTPDKPPAVVITSHEGELEVSPQDTLKLEFSAHDDFGLIEIARVSVFVGSEDEARAPLELPALQGHPTELLGELSLELSEFALQPRDRVVVQIEAIDNNTLTGPGVGRSEPLVLYVSSPDDKHLKNLEAQREIVEALFILLADYLEAPLGERAIDERGVWHQRVAELLPAEERSARFERLGQAHQGGALVFKAMGDLVELLKQDPMMVERDLTLFASLHAQLDRLHAEGQRKLERSELAARQRQLTLSELERAADWSMQMEDALEKGILRLEDLLFSQQAKSIEASMQEVQELKARLKEMLERYKESNDPAIKEAIKREMQRLRARMQEMLNRMQSQLKELPAEHVNREAVEQQRMESAANKAVDDFRSIEELLERGDIDAALAALEQMGENLDEMEQMVSEQFEQAEPEALSEFDQEMNELIDDANDLSELQQQLERDTDALQQELKAERGEQMKEQLEALKKELSQEIARQREQLDAMENAARQANAESERAEAERATRQLERALEQGDVETALEASERAREQIDKMRLQAGLSKRLQSSSQRRQAADQVIERANGARRRAERISDELEGMMEQANAQGSRRDGRAEQLAERQQQVEQRAGQIEQKIDDAAQKYPGLNEQLKGPMKQGREAMKDAEKGLRQQRMQRALDSERQAMQSLRQLKQSMRDSVKKERQQRQRQQEGERGGESEKVKLPGQSERNQPIYRELLQEGMKEGRLEEYESDIDRYYESLGQ